MTSSLHPRRTRPTGTERMLAAVVSGIVALVFLLSGEHHAAALHVRARAALDVRTSVDGEGGLAVGGRLVDDAGDPIPGEIVQVVVAGCYERTIPTGETGAFRLVLSPETLGRCATDRRGSWPLAVHFGGNARQGAASFETRIAADRLPTNLELDLRPRAVRLDGEVALRVRLLVGEQPVPGALVSLRLGPEKLSERRTDDKGLVRLSTSASGGTPPGEWEVRADFAGSGLLGPATRTVPLRVFIVPDISLSAAVKGGRIVASGSVVADGAPVPGETVDLLIGEDVAFTTQTGAEGRFDAEVPARAVTAAHTGSPLEIRARTRPAVAGRGTATSAAVIVLMPAAPPMPLSTYVVPGALLLLVLFVAGTRLEVWARLGRGLWGWRPGRVRATPSGDANGRFPRAQPPRAVDGPHDAWDVEVRLVSQEGDRPLPGARARLVVVSDSGGAGAVHAVAGHDGWLRLRGGAAGFHQLEAEAPLHVPVRVSVTLPHAGELHGIVLVLTPLRLAASDLLTTTADRRMGAGQARWGRDTPREVLPSLAATVPGREARAESFVAAVECACFGLDDQVPEAFERAVATAKSLDGEAG